MSDATAPFERGLVWQRDPAAGSAPPLASPLDAQPKKTSGPAIVGAAGALVVHVVLVLLAGVVVSAAASAHPRVTTRVTHLMDVEPPLAVARPAPAESPPAAAEPTPAAPRPRVAVPKREAPPPEAAQAGKVLAVAGDVVDFGDTFVAGTGRSYAGGVTERGGTATHAVTGVRARAGGVEGGTGTGRNGDRTRAPQLAGGASWDCPFPEEADDAGIDHALVTLRVEVDRAGLVARVEVTRDPGDGFGREARRCALRKRWSAGLDRAGVPTAAAAIVNVRFDR